MDFLSLLFILSKNVRTQQYESRTHAVAMKLVRVASGT